MPPQAWVIGFLCTDANLYLQGVSMHRAPTPMPDDEPFEENDPVPEPGEPSPENDPVPDHNPS